MEKLYVFCDVTECKHCKEDKHYNERLCQREGHIWIRNDGKCDYYERNKTEW